ncbi:hypothetical protein BDD43_1612 [Mucilaginibacter gracilis]|uniref:Uncharacterized protein n=1 Tax=Mucilaginibacter gracilis TaxID=423350 RepID=A0A495IXP8_9SPHI|nr:hypothetical protein [Mucilaginibacter gracilis]RKR81465.1 hypothetical protein BDD43_1612 [Mucilaginibacter gracilis]
MNKKLILFAMALLAVMAFACNKKQTTDGSANDTITTPITYTGTGSVTQGLGIKAINSLYNCSGGRVTSVGAITSSDGKIWTVPADVAFSNSPKLPDLYNECNGKTPASISAVDTTNVPVTVIDPDGVIVSGYIFCDNYFELYINGKLLGVDAVPYTPFNSCFVKFKARRPIKYAVKLVDWEENMGIGSENNGTDPLHPGDGGFIAKFSDGTQTGSAWKAQVFYIAPLADPNCITENGSARTSAGCNLPASASKAYALHWALPATWYSADYNFSSWPAATTYSNTVVGAKEPYTNFAPQFGAAQFIWSSNLVLDNLVLLRFTGN